MALLQNKAWEISPNQNAQDVGTETRIKSMSGEAIRIKPNAFDLVEGIWFPVGGFDDVTNAKIADYLNHELTLKG